MIKVKVNCCVPESEKYEISICEQRATVTGVEKTAQFNIETPGQYVLNINQVKEKVLPKAWDIMLFLITAPIRGILHAVFFDVDTDWENQIKAFLLSCSILIDVREDISIDLTFENSHFNHEKRTYDPPSISINPSLQTKTSSILNHEDIDLQYNRFLKRLLSVGSFLVALLLSFLFSKPQPNAVKNADVYITSFFVLFFAIITFIWIYNSRKRRRLKSLFLKQIEKTEKTGDSSPAS